MDGRYVSVEHAHSEWIDTYRRTASRVLGPVLVTASVRDEAGEVRGQVRLPQGAAAYMVALSGYSVCLDEGLPEGTNFSLSSLLEGFPMRGNKFTNTTAGRQAGRIPPADETIMEHIVYAGIIVMLKDECQKMWPFHVIDDMIKEANGMLLNFGRING